MLQVDPPGVFNSFLPSLFIGTWIQSIVNAFKPATLDLPVGGKLGLSILCNLLGFGIFAALARVIAPEHRQLLVWSVYTITTVTTILALLTLYVIHKKPTKLSG